MASVARWAVRLLALGCVVWAAFLFVSPFAPAGGTRTVGEEVFAANCARCHGAGGAGGGIGPQLAGRGAERFPVRIDQIHFVSEGRGAMPAFGATLSQAELGAVVDYVRALPAPS